MQDKPSSTELIAAVAHFIREEILPTQSDPRLQFRIRVALNAMEILQRETCFGNQTRMQEITRLSEHLEFDIPDLPPTEAEVKLNWELANRIRSGNFPDQTLEFLLEVSRAKLAISSPRTLAKYSLSSI
jgi:hypothetical protein